MNTYVEPTENTLRIRAIRACVALAAPDTLSGWDIARLSRMWQDNVSREPQAMLILLHK